MRMKQSDAQIEAEFQLAMEDERRRRGQLRKQAAQRKRAKRRMKVERGGRYRFFVLVISLTATVVLVTVAMFEILALVMG